MAGRPQKTANEIELWHKRPAQRARAKELAAARQEHEAFLKLHGIMPLQPLKIKPLTAAEKIALFGHAWRKRRIVMRRPRNGGRRETVNSLVDVAPFGGRHDG